MKIPFILSLSLFLFINLCGYAQKTSPPTRRTTDVRHVDESAVQAVIRDETDAFVERDSIRLLSFYTHDALTQSAWNNPNGTFGLLRGYPHIRENFRQAFRQHPERQHLPQVERTDWYFRRLAPDWMWVNFTQKMTLTNGDLYTNHEARLMKREHGKWRISVMYALSDHARKNP